MKKTKKLILITLLLTIVLSAICSNNILAYTKNQENVKGGLYSYTVTLKKSEEVNFFENIENNITFNSNEYSKSNIEKIKDSANNQKTVTKKITNEKLLDTKNKDKVKSMFNKNIDYAENGFKGKIALKDVQITTIPQGYYEKIEKLDLKFSGYSQNELAKIKKEINKNGEKWYLIDVDWKEETLKVVDGTNVPQTFSGVKHYERVKKYKYPSKYKATAIYEGEVKNIDPEYTYKISYSIIEKEEPVKKVEEKKEEAKTNIVAPKIIGSIGIIIILVVYIMQKNKNKKDGRIKNGTKKNLRP